jgi:hypothetical protein
MSDALWYSQFSTRNDCCMGETIEARKVVIYQRLPHGPHDCQESPAVRRLTLTNHSQIWGPVTGCDGAPHVSGW